MQYSGLLRDIDQQGVCQPHVRGTKKRGLRASKCDFRSSEHNGQGSQHHAPMQQIWLSLLATSPCVSRTVKCTERNIRRLSTPPHGRIRYQLPATEYHGHGRNRSPNIPHLWHLRRSQEFLDRHTLSCQQSAQRDADQQNLTQPAITRAHRSSHRSTPPHEPVRHPRKMASRTKI